MNQKIVAQDGGEFINFWKGKSIGEGFYGETYPTEVIGFVVDTIKKVKSYSRGTVLDIGCGRDMFLSKQIQSFCPDLHVAGIDILEPTAIDIGSNIRYSQESAYNIKCNSNSIDIIVSTFVYDYLDKHRGLEELRRVLKSDGSGVLIFHHPDAPVVKGLQIRNISSNSTLMHLEELICLVYSNNFAGITVFTKKIEESLLRTNIQETTVKKALFELDSTARRIQINPEIEKSLCLELKALLWETKASIDTFDRLFNNLFPSERCLNDFLISKSFIPETYIIHGLNHSITGYGVIIKKA